MQLTDLTTNTNQQSELFYKHKVSFTDIEDNFIFLSATICMHAFLEAMINLMWTNLMNSKFARKSSTESEREWTCMIKIDELCMLGEIDENQREILHKLRKKRNAVFHVDPWVAKREVTGDDCLEAIKIGLTIFYKLIGSPWGDNIIEFQNVAKLMYVAIHGPPQDLTLK